jgi:molybdopterin synthase catalytic subunit
MVQITDKPIQPEVLRERLSDPSCGALVAFEGLVRNHHAGKKVAGLSYECYRPMALKVLESIRREAMERWELRDLFISHRTGNIPIGEAAVWVGTASSHRKEAFAACAWAMDEIKRKAPIWKHETYEDGTSLWVEDHCVEAHNHPPSPTIAAARLRGTSG